MNCDVKYTIALFKSSVIDSVQSWEPAADLARMNSDFQIKHVAFNFLAW